MALDPWRQLLAHQTASISYFAMINESLWYSTDCRHGEKGMVQYNYKTNKVINIVKYPSDLRIINHSSVAYKGKIYIINGWKGEIILFDPVKEVFTKNKQYQD